MLTVFRRGRQILNINTRSSECSLPNWIKMGWRITIIAKIKSDNFRNSANCIKLHILCTWVTLLLSELWTTWVGFLLNERVFTCRRHITGAGDFECRQNSVARRIVRNLARWQPARTRRGWSTGNLRDVWGDYWLVLTACHWSRAPYVVNLRLDGASGPAENPRQGVIIGASTVL